MVDPNRSACVIRASEENDAEEFHRISAQPNSYLWTLQLPFPSLHEWQTKLRDQSDRRTLVAEREGRVVGMLGLHWGKNPRLRHVVSLGMTVDEGVRRTGIGRELMKAAVELAENWLGFTRIELTVYTDNEPAIKLYEQFGFRKEGTLRSYAFRNGKLTDAFLMARIRE